uniref:Uncharacterized protein n=1 Tax=Ditylenchus dipsaci TaxID=166011 RepID=A0A915D901_9BILA
MPNPPPSGRHLGIPALRKAELTGTRDLKGEIQVLQYKGDHLSLDTVQLDQCGVPFILWASRPQGASSRLFWILQLTSLYGTSLVSGDGSNLERQRKIAACFSWGGHEYRNKLVPFRFSAINLNVCVDLTMIGARSKKLLNFSANKEWHPVHVNHHKGDISPGVLMIDGKEMLGKVDVRNERASVGHGGTEKALVGQAVHTTKVCGRKARAGLDCHKVPLECHWNATSARGMPPKSLNPVVIQ